MGRETRNGSRKPRSQRKAHREPSLGYYVIVTDTEGTERRYFEGIRECSPKAVSGKLVIRVVETKTKDLIQKCRSEIAYEPQYRIPWIILDRDEVVNFDEILRKAETNGIHVGWSNPCFEVWLWGYFGELPNHPTSKQCVSSFAAIFKKKTKVDYHKNNPKLYELLIKHGNESAAIERAENRILQHLSNAIKNASKMCPSTTVHRLVMEIRSKANR